MKWTNVRLIFLREVRDQLRDRRTMFTIAVLPLLLYPLLGMIFLQVAQFTREHPTTVLVLGADALPESPQLFEGERFAAQFAMQTDAGLQQLTVRPTLSLDSQDTDARRSAEDLVQTGRYDTVVLFPKDFSDRLQQFRKQVASRENGEQDEAQSGGVPRPEIVVNTASDKSRIAGERVERVLRQWRDAIVRENLRERNVPVAATRPFQLVNTDVAREHSRRAALWSKILPFVVLIWALTGAFYPAIDLCAGEKERGTLETLLCSPAQRGEIVWGKLLTIMAFSMATSVLNLLSMGMTSQFIIGRISELGGASSQIGLSMPPFSAVCWLLLALIPIAALFSALALAIAAFARSSKEGQYYLMPLLLITLPLMMLPLLPTVELDMGTSLIPVTGVMLLLRALIEAQYLEALRYALPVMGITVVCCLLAIRWAIDQFNNESVLFRESERWDLGLWLRHVVRDRADTPSLGEALLCGLLILLIRFFAGFALGMPDSWPRFAMITVVTLMAFIAAPALLMTVALTRSPRQTLLLRFPKPMALPMAIALAVVIHPAGVAFAEGVKSLYPISSDMSLQMMEIGRLIDQAPNLLSILLVLAVTPAICEEVAFRGFILSGLRHLGHKWAAVLVSSVFFGLTHGMLQQSLTACAIGMVIGYVAVQTGSLLPGLLFHATYNSLSLVMAWNAAQWTESYPMLQWLIVGTQDAFGYHWPVVGGSVALTIGLLLWFRALPFEASAEESLQTALIHGERLVKSSEKPAVEREWAAAEKDRVLVRNHRA